ncbi:hypothetical protein OKW24_005351 [Peribacillus simplex]|nr:hypothetical protein [Peribacillus simplex]
MKTSVYLNPPKGADFKIKKLTTLKVQPVFIFSLSVFTKALTRIPGNY